MWLTGSVHTSSSLRILTASPHLSTSAAPRESGDIVSTVAGGLLFLVKFFLGCGCLYIQVAAAPEEKGRTGGSIKKCEEKEPAKELEIKNKEH